MTAGPLKAVALALHLAQHWLFCVYMDQAVAPSPKEGGGDMLVVHKSGVVHGWALAGGRPGGFGYSACKYTEKALKTGQRARGTAAVWPTLVWNTSIHRSHQSNM